MPMKENEKKFGKVMLKIGIVMLIFAVLFDVISVIYTILYMSLPMALDEVAAEIVLQLVYGFLYLAAFVIPAFILCAMCGKDIISRPLERKIPVNSAVYIFAGITLITAMAYINSMLVSLLGLPSGSIEDSGVSADNYTFILAFITTAIVPAICEEFLFRGAIMHSLLKFGKVPAILISAVMFGLMHTNFAQFFYATAAGIFLGWVACETGSLYCGMLIHFSQNFFSVFQSVLFDRMKDPTLSIVYYALMCLIFAAGIPCIIYLAVKFSRDLRSSRRERLDDGIYGVSDDCTGALALPAGRATRLFFSPTVIIFIVVAVFMAFSRVLTAWLTVAVS